MEEAVKQLTDIPAINRFLSYCRVRTVPSKTALIHAGDLPDVLYYIIRGSVEVMIEDEDGNEMVLAYLNKGQFFGEMSLISGRRRSATVLAGAGCVLVDLHMPGMGGLGLLENLACRGQRPPVLVLTASRDPRLEARARELGADAYLTKPVSESRLLGALRSAQSRT